jgi:prepilin-type N-terminal cleavage/methylation domain-containing protein
MKKAFTLIELMIVVAILGILAAVVVTSVQGQASCARDAAAKNIVKTLRNQIELYKFHHNDLQPGLINGTATSALNIVKQFTNCTKEDGSTSPFTKRTGAYVYGPYFPEMAVNPYNNLSTILIVPAAIAFSAAADDSSGWLYKIETAEIKVNSTGTGTGGVVHYDY